MRTKLSRRLLALLLAAVFLFANVPTFGAEGDSGTGSRGDVTGDGTAASAGDGKTESSYGSGSKVTLMVANKGDYNSGYIMDFTPMSDGAWAGLNPSQVGEYPIYFISGSLTKEFTRTNESDAHDISSLIVSGGGAAFGVDNAIYNRINSAFSLDWNNAVSENYVENTLEIKHQEDIQNDEAAKKKNADTLGALLKIMAVKHPEMISDYPELQGVIDGTGGGKQDYIFLVEPLVPARREASSYSYTTILNFASMLNGTAASIDSDFKQTVKKMSGKGGWFNLKPKFIGNIVGDGILSSAYSGGGNTIASKIYYSGPTKPDGAVEGDDSMFGGSDLDGSDGYDKIKRANASDNKWGFGVLFLGDYLTPDDDSVLQMHIMDVNLADKKAKATKVILRPDVISQRNSLTSRESVTIGEAEVRHAKTDANAYYGGLDAALKSSDFTISKKQLPTEFDGDFIRGKLTGANVGDKLTYGTISAGGALNREAFSVTMGMQTENKVFAPTPPDLGKSGDKYALSGYANAPKNVDIAKVVPSLENSYAAIGLNHDMADEYFNRNIKTVYSGAFDLNFKPKDGVDANNLSGTTSVMLNGAAYAWWAAASEYISGQISSGNFSVNYGGGTAQIVQETAGSEFIYGIRPNDSDTNFKYRKVSDTGVQTALNGLLKSSSAIKDATNETNAVAYKISESGILERNLTVTKATPADEVAKIQDAVSVLGEDVMRANSRGIITYANSGVGSFTNIEGFPEKTFGSETLDYRGYYGELPQFVALFDAYTPVDLIVIKDGLVDEI
ncbi:hypothetical protein AGMMS49975_18900 [Clostridia bacterium]|nr:hypothetical protein AGMMS49975_18900 [Clostridia bacterium]